MQVIICDTEPAVRKYLAGMVENLGHHVVAQVDKPDEAIIAIKAYQPEIMLLSAHDPHVEGFYDMLSKDFEYPPALIFSGLDDLDAMMTAIKAGMSDYLMVPVRLAELKNSLERACRLNAAHCYRLSQEDGKHTRQRQYIAARTHRGVELIALSDVYYFTADQKYVKVRHKNGIVLIDETLKELEQEFENAMFRIHRNALINLDYLDLLETLENGQCRVHFRDIPEKLAVSRRHLPMLREKIHNI